MCSNQCFLRGQDKLQMHPSPASTVRTSASRVQKPPHSLDNRGVVGRLYTEASDFLLAQALQTSSVSHPTVYTNDIGCSISEGERPECETDPFPVAEI
jgi:hypothetical protein